MKPVLLVSLALATNLSMAQTSHDVYKTSTNSDQSSSIGDRAKPNVKNIQLSTGVRLNYVEQGNKKGTPVILLHGVGDSWRSFETTMSFLPSSLRVFAITQRGHGDSEKPTEGYSAADFAGDVAAFIKEKKLGKVIVVGHSLGGMVAQHFALNYPQLTEAIVIMASTSAPSKIPGSAEFSDFVMQLEEPMYEEFMKQFQQGSLANPIDSNYFKMLLAEGMKLPLQVFKAVFTAFNSFDVTNQLANITQPAMIAFGEKDTNFPAETQQSLINNIQNATIIEYEGAGHAFHWEQPKKVADDIAAFIDIDVKKKADKK
jgi:non-heme chloroperoxidase